MRAIERLGEILVELRHAPDPRVLVEVALVQLTSVPDASAGDDIGPLAARVTALEQALAAGAAPAAPAAPKDPTTGRTALGGRAKRARRRCHGGDGRGATTAAGRRTAAGHTPARGAGRRGPRRAAEPAARLAERATCRAEWSEVRPTLKGIAKPVFAALELERAADDTVTFAAAERGAPRQVRERARGRRGGVAGRHRARRAHRAADEGRTGAARRRAAAADADDEDIDLDDLVDAAPGTVPTTLDRLAEAFPGSQLVERERPS